MQVCGGISQSHVGSKRRGVATPQGHHSNHSAQTRMLSQTRPGIRAGLDLACRLEPLLFLQCAPPSGRQSLLVHLSIFPFVGELRLASHQKDERESEQTLSRLATCQTQHTGWTAPTSHEREERARVD